MINNHFPTVFAALVVVAALTAPAKAAEQTAVVSRGIAPTGEREFGAKMLVCNTCHGAETGSSPGWGFGFAGSDVVKSQHSD